MVQYSFYVLQHLAAANHHASYLCCCGSFPSKIANRCYHLHIITCSGFYYATGITRWPYKLYQNWLQKDDRFLSTVTTNSSHMLFLSHSFPLGPWVSLFFLLYVKVSEEGGFQISLDKTDRLTIFAFDQPIRRFVADRCGHGTHRFIQFCCVYKNASHPF